MYRCPFCEDFTTDSLGALSSHMKTHIRGDYCPVCKKYYKDVKKHFRAHAEKDDMHAILYTVTAKHRSNRDNEYMKKLRERALKLIEVTEDS